MIVKTALPKFRQVERSLPLRVGPNTGCSPAAPPLLKACSKSVCLTGKYGRLNHRGGSLEIWQAVHSLPNHYPPVRAPSALPRNSNYHTFEINVESNVGSSFNFVGTKADMTTRAESEMARRIRPADVEEIGILVLALVAICRTIEDQHSAFGLHRRAADIGVTGDIARETTDRRLHPQRLVDRVGNQGRIGLKLRKALRPCVAGFNIMTS